MEASAGLYDSIDYPKDYPLHSITYKKVPGKMKNDCTGVPIAEFFGLRSKMYSQTCIKGTPSGPFLLSAKCRLSAENRFPSF